MNASKHRVELVVAVDKNGFHGQSEMGLSERLAGAKYDMAKRQGMNGTNEG
jgi:hypothetical protein